MVLYWSLFAMMAFFSIAEQASFLRKKTIIIMFYAMVMVLFFLSFARWERGTDWQAYYIMFKDIESRSWDTHTEFGYLLLNRIVRRYTDNYTIYLFVQSGIYYSLFIYFVKKINELMSSRNHCCYFPILLYSFSQGFAGMFNVRSTIAYFICLIALFDVYEKKRFRFLIKIIVASSIHLSSLLFIIVYPLFGMKLKKVNIALMLLIAIAFSQLGAFYDYLLISVNFGDYTQYIEEGQLQNIMGVLRNGILLFLLFYIRPKGYNEMYSGVAKIYLLGFLIYLWCQFYSPVAQRLSGLFMSSILVWIAMIFSSYRRNDRLIFLYGCIIYCLISLWSLLGSTSSDLFVPYKFFWDTFAVEVY